MEENIVMINDTKLKIESFKATLEQSDFIEYEAKKIKNMFEPITCEFKLADINVENLKKLFFPKLPRKKKKKLYGLKKDQRRITKRLLKNISIKREDLKRIGMIESTDQIVCSYVNNKEVIK